MRALSTIFLMLALELCPAVPVFCGEINVLDGKIFQGTSGYQARTNDELLNNVVRKVDAVIFGSLDGPSNPPNQGHHAIYSITVIECYKGGLRPGDKIGVMMQGDGETPDVRDLAGIGKKGFFFINARPDKAPGMAGVYECNPIDIAPYARYGEPMRKFLRTVRSQ